MKPFYQDEFCTIYHGDCREVLTRLEMVDHIVTDPPYSSHTHAKQWIGHALTSEGAPRVSTKFKELGFDPLTPELMAYICERARVLTKRWTLSFCDLESIGKWQAALSKAELDYVRSCVWDKVDGAPQFTGDRPAAGAEAIICAHQKGAKRWNGGGRRNVFRYAVNGASRGAKPHPSTKPLKLMRELIELFTDEGETILDPFMGSGTTLRAAKELGRKAIGIEANKDYCLIAVERLSQIAKSVEGQATLPLTNDCAVRLSP
jgi:site-specific DNA-methyltransferase (adenine-specific)